MDKIKEIVHRLNDKAINPEKDTDLLLDELNRIGIFFVDTDSRTEWYFNEPTTKSNTSEKANDLITDVSDMFSFGDIVEAKCTATGRYIGKGKCVYISAMTNERCVDNVKEKCENTYDLPVVDDNELENYR